MPASPVCFGCGLDLPDGPPVGRCATCERVMTTWAGMTSMMMMAVLRMARLHGCRCDPHIEPAPPGLVVTHPDSCPLRRASMAPLN